MNSLLPQLRRPLAALFVGGLLVFAGANYLLAKQFNVPAFAAFAVLLGAATGGVFAVLRRDLHKREQTHAKNHEVRQSFESLAQSSPAGIFRANQQGDILFVNHRWCALTGRSQAESQGFGCHRIPNCGYRTATRSTSSDETSWLVESVSVVVIRPFK